MVDAWMRQLEVSGRADGTGGLSARAVRYGFILLRAALSDAVRQGRLAGNPTDRATPPSPSEARPPEMQAWTAAELARFMRWADADDPDLAMCWRLLAATGMRRGEVLALRWRDVDLDAGRLQVRCSVGTVKDKGAGQRLMEGPTESGQSRVVDLDAGTVAALRAYRAAREQVSPGLVRDSALVLSGLDGSHRHPERFSRRFTAQVVRARKALGEEQLPVIRLHDLRHTHATLLLADGVPVKLVSERLGHASATITLTVYQHVHPGMGRREVGLPPRRRRISRLRHPDHVVPGRSGGCRTDIDSPGLCDRLAPHGPASPPPRSTHDRRAGARAGPRSP
ncbi:tyrosine-type recombinase/integrase [Geodermatophilus amargosae]